MPLDNQSELFFLVDENDNVLGSISRQEAHQSPDKIHRAVSVILTNEAGQILLQKRSLKKDTEPGKWTVTSSGHVTYPDSYEVSAERELQEEMGITTNLTFFAKSLMIGKSEKEIESIFIGHYEGTPENFDRDEVSEVKWVTKDELKEMEKKGEITLFGKYSLTKLGYLEG